METNTSTTQNNLQSLSTKDILAKKDKKCQMSTSQKLLPNYGQASIFVPTLKYLAAYYSFKSFVISFYTELVCLI